MDLKKPMFSIVIPLYNKEAFIEDSLNSVINQTFKNFEIIVVNDGSTDNSLKIVESFSDPRLKVFTKENGGVSAARNYGIAMSQNEYVALLDADDNWEIGFLNEMKELIEKYPTCGLYACAYNRVTASKTIIDGNKVPEGIEDDFFRVILQHRVPMSSAVVVRREIFEDVGGFPVGMFGGEDNYTWCKIANKYEVAFTPKVLANYNLANDTSFERNGKMDYCKESWFDFYQEGNFYRNEFVAKKAIQAGIRYAFGAPQTKSIEIEKLTRFTVLSKKSWKYLFFLNRLPRNGLALLKITLPAFKNSKSQLGNLKRKMEKVFN